LPLPLWAASLAASAVVSAVAGAVAWRHRNNFKDELKGKVITVLGPRGAGKTTLVTFLSKGELPVEYVSTAKPEKFGGRSIEMNDLQLVLQTIVDVPGDKHSYVEWERQYKKADVVCYLVDASKIQISDDAYIKLVSSEMRNLGDWLREREADPPKTFLAATHCDLIPEYVNLPYAGKHTFLDDFWKTPAVEQFVLRAGGQKHVRCIAGSLATKRGAEHLVGELLHEVRR